MAAQTNENAPYNESSITRTVIEDTGNYACPTSDGFPEVVNLHEPIEYLLVDFDLSRSGGPPVVPSKVTLDPNLTLMDAKVSSDIPFPDGLGTKVFRVYGRYKYLINRTDGFTGDFQTGRYPWDPESGTANAIPAANFSKNLVGDTAVAETAQTFTSGS